MKNRKIIAIGATTGVVMVICSVLMYVYFDKKQPNINNESVPEIKIATEETIEEEQIQNDYGELLKGLVVDEDNIIINPTIDDDTGSMSGENSKGEFIQTPPIEIPETEEEQLKALLEVAGLTEKEVEEAIKEVYPESVKAETVPEQNKPVENNVAEKPNENKVVTWEDYIPGGAKVEKLEVTEIKPGEGSTNQGTDWVIFN